MEPPCDSSSIPDASEARVQLLARRAPSRSIHEFPQHDCCEEGSTRRRHKVRFREYDR